MLDTTVELCVCLPLFVRRLSRSVHSVEEPVPHSFSWYLRTSAVASLCWRWCYCYLCCFHCLVIMSGWVITFIGKCSCGVFTALEYTPSNEAAGSFSIMFASLRPWGLFPRWGCTISPHYSPSGSSLQLLVKLSVFKPVLQKLLGSDTLLWFKSSFFK